MNHALNEANELQRRIDDLLAQRKALKRAPVDEKLRAKRDAAEKERDTLRKQLEKAQAKFEAVQREYNSAEIESESRYNDVYHDLNNQGIVLTTARNALLSKVINPSPTGV